MNTPNSPSPIHFSEQALPPDVSVSSDTWLNRYRNFPVFSRTWFRYRAIALGMSQTVIMIITTIVFFSTQEEWTKYLVRAVPMYLGFTSLYLTGQSIAVWVRQKKYPVRKESILLCLAIAFGVFVSYGVSYYSHIGLERALDHPSKRTENSAANTPTTTTKNVSLTSNVASSTSSEKNSNTRLEKLNPMMRVMLAIMKMTILAIPVTYIGSGFDLWVFFRQRKRLVEAQRQQELRRAQEARREAELRLSVLVAQVEPHFLFNTLAGVRSAILTEPLRATAIVDHLADYLRSTIPQMRSDGGADQGRLAKQLETTKAYLGLMQARIPRLTFSITSTISDAALPPMLLISLVENAVKHGIEPKVGPAHISVIAHTNKQDGEEKLEISVADNGVGFGGTTLGSGIGLSNIHERLESMYGSRASLQLKAGIEGGVVATIILPLSI